MPPFIIFAVVISGTVIITGLASVLIIKHRYKRTWRPSLFSVDLQAMAMAEARIGTRSVSIPRELLHPYLGYVLNPGSDELAWRDSGWERPNINEMGFQGNSALRKREPDCLIVGIFGGSVARAFVEYLEKQGPGSLFVNTKYHGRKIHNACYALGGYKQPQQLVALTYLLSLGAEFDVVINVDGFNEVALHPVENAPQGTAPSFPRNWATRTALQVDANYARALGTMTVCFDIRKAACKWFSVGLLKYLPQLYLMWLLLDKRLANTTDRAIQTTRRTRPSTHSTLLADGCEEQMEPFAALAGLWARSSVTMHRLCNGHGIEYIHVLQPNQYFPGSKVLSIDELRSAFDSTHPYRRGVEQGYPLLRDAARELIENGVRFIDATMIYSNESRRTYLDTCCHLNDLGNNLLFACIRGWLETVCPSKAR